MNDAVGRTCRKIDQLDPGRAEALHATLGHPGLAPRVGDPLPAFWHQIYFLDALPPDALGRDGHPKPGEFIPDTGLPRRMWAGGEVDFPASLRLGQEATRTSTILNVSRKQGRSGPLAIVTILHEIYQNGTACICERQHLAYLEDRSRAAPPPPILPAPADATRQRSVHFSPTLLFRYSALTFNGHRIHYDRDYCRKVEGYPGLVVHGPLLAQLLIDFALVRLHSVQKFTFRATAPLFDFETAELCARDTKTGQELWVHGPGGRLCMTASATGLRRA